MAEKTPEEVFYESLMAEEEPAEEGPTADSEDPPDKDYQLRKEAQQLLSKKVTPRNLFSYTEADPIVLDYALLREFQYDWLTWDDDVLFEEIEESFRSSIAEVNRHKIMVVKTLHVHDAFWEQWEVFEKAILSLNGIIPRLRYMQPPELPALFAGIDVANTLRDEEYSEQVGRYVAACFLNEEVSYAPPPLEFAQIYVSNPRYSCGECGKEGSALPPFDGRCDSCSRRFEDHPFNFRPAEDAKDDPSKVSYELEIDPQPVKKRYEELRDLSSDELRSEMRAEPEDVEAARLLMAYDYMKLRSQHRARQLRDLKDWLESS